MPSTAKACDTYGHTGPLSTKIRMGSRDVGAEPLTDYFMSLISSRSVNMPLHYRMAFLCVFQHPPAHEGAQR